MMMMRENLPAAKHGQIKTFRSAIFPGSLDLVTNERIIVLPWFIRAKDHGTGEVSEDGK